MNRCEFVGGEVQPQSRARATVHGLLVATVGALLLQIAGGAVSAERPNIVYILADDVGLGDVPIYNPATPLRLPALQALAAEGLRFTDAHTSASKCAPSRYSIITGNYQWRGRGRWGTWGYTGGSQILPGQQTLGNILQRAGYATSFIGKYHLGADFYVKGSNALANVRTAESQIDFSRPMLSGPSQRGFGHSFVLMRGIQDSPYAFFENDRIRGSLANLINWSVGDYGDTRITAAGIGLSGYNTRDVGPTLLNQAIHFINQHRLGPNRASPFFLYLNTEGVHSPQKPPLTLAGQPIQGATRISPRTDMLLEIDVMLREIVRTLNQYGIADNTLIVFASDNGALTTAGEMRRGHDGNAGLRGGKGTIYEGGHRVPLIVKWGRGGFQGSTRLPGSQVSGLVGVQDLYATLAELVGVPLGADLGRDSVSLLPLLRGSGVSPRRTMIQQADRSASKAKEFSYAYRSGDWKLILTDSGVARELYNLAADRREQINLVNSREHASLVQTMTADFRRDLAAPRTAPVSLN
jgi:arylsulfatase A-like enzyme